MNLQKKSKNSWLLATVAAAVLLSNLPRSVFVLDMSAHHSSRPQETCDEGVFTEQAPGNSSWCFSRDSHEDDRN